MFSFVLLPIGFLLPAYPPLPSPMAMTAATTSPALVKEELGHVICLLEGPMRQMLEKIEYK